MTELKTLKDMKGSFWDKWFSKEDQIDLILSDIKKEAIKWVKRHEGANSTKLMRLFHNITEEDLK